MSHPSIDVLITFSLISIFQLEWLSFPYVLVSFQLLDPSYYILPTFSTEFASHCLFWSLVILSYNSLMFVESLSWHLEYPSHFPTRELICFFWVSLFIFCWCCCLVSTAPRFQWRRSSCRRSGRWWTLTRPIAGPCTLGGTVSSWSPWRRLSTLPSICTRVPILMR